MLCSFCPLTNWAASRDSVELAQNHRRTMCTEHASKEIRPAKGLELYIFKTQGLFCEVQAKKRKPPPLWHPSFLGLSPDPGVTEQTKKSYGVHHFPGKTRDKGKHHRSRKKGPIEAKEKN